MAGASSVSDNVENEEIIARKSELETKIRNRVACEERAFRIVEKLIEGTISTDYLIECGRFITPSHYADIVEERAIIKQCGYPACGNSLGKVPQQKYHISTQSNKVYDITERKNFCSNQCFKASKYFEKQISTIPVWLRETEIPQQLKVLDPIKNLGSVGLEVIGEKVPFVAKINDDDETETEADDNKSCQESTDPEQSSESTPTISEPSVKPSSTNTAVQLGPLSTTHDVIDDPACRLGEDISENLNINPTELRKSTTTCNTPGEKKIEDSKILTEPSKNIKAEKNVSKTEYLMQLLNKRKNLLSQMVDDQQIVSSETSEQISSKKPFNDLEKGKELEITERNVPVPKISVLERASKVPPKTSEKSLKTGVKFTPIPDCKPVRHPDVIVSQSSDLPRSLDVVLQRLSEWVTIATLKYLEVKSEDSAKGDKSGVSREQKDEVQPKEDKKSEPEFHTLQEQSKDFIIKVRQFYKGSSVLKDPEHVPMTEHEKLYVDSDKEPVLPPVDSVAQMRIRRKIVLQKLEKSVPDVLIPMGLAIQHIASELCDLVNTFHLTSQNVMMKPVEWKLTSLFLIRMLREKVPVLLESFTQGTSLQAYQDVLSRNGTSLYQFDSKLEQIYNETALDDDDDVLDDDMHS